VFSYKIESEEWEKNAPWGPGKSKKNTWPGRQPGNGVRSSLIYIKRREGSKEEKFKKLNGLEDRQMTP